jgi:orotate phosphoribosyltransferase
VDDILRSGRQLSSLKALVESKGADVVGLAVLIYQPTPQSARFDPLPFYHLIQLDAVYYKDASSCDLCTRGVPIERVWI